MVKFSIGRPARMHGLKIERDMGVRTWAAFAGGEDNAVVDGDFALTDDWSERREHVELRRKQVMQ